MIFQCCLEMPALSISAKSDFLMLIAWPMGSPFYLPCDAWADFSVLLTGYEFGDERPVVVGDEVLLVRNERQRPLDGE